MVVVIFTFLCALNSIIIFDFVLTLQHHYSTSEYVIWKCSVGVVFLIIYARSI